MEAAKDVSLCILNVCCQLVTQSKPQSGFVESNHGRITSKTKFHNVDLSMVMKLDHCYYNSTVIR